MKNKIIIIVFVLFFGALISWYICNKEIKDFIAANIALEPISINKIEPPKIPEQEITQEEPPEIEIPEPEPEPEIELPREINLDVPYTVQAPHANWNEPYQNACEEAAILMVDHFYKGKEIPSKEYADKELLKLVDYQNKTLGDYKDTDTEETAQILRDYFGFKNVKVVWDPSIEDIKRELAKGRPVVVPCYGRGLGNPNYTSPGPIYHMLVIKGYRGNKFITNDAGTRKGREYIYDMQVVINAVHDWNDGDIQNGEKAMITVIP